MKRRTPLGVGFDLASDNIMLDSKGNLVITDPWSLHVSNMPWG